MKNIKFIIILSLYSLNSFSDDLIEEKNLNQLLKNGYKINEKYYSNKEMSDGSVYFVLENNNSDIVLCKVPASSFFDKTLCKRP